MGATVPPPLTITQVTFSVVLATAAALSAIAASVWAPTLASLVAGVSPVTDECQGPR